MNTATPPGPPDGPQNANGPPGKGEPSRANHQQDIVRGSDCSPGARGLQTGRIATLPEELSRLPAWLVWGYRQREGEPKPRKVPYYANGSVRKGTQGSPADRAQLATFEVASARAARGKFDGVGLAMLADHGLVALDFDGCVLDGVVDPRVLELVDGTYAEVSPSGKGVRAFYRGQLDDRKDTDASVYGFGFEVFHAKGFVTVTGNAIGDSELWGVAELPERVRAYAARRMGVREKPAPLAELSMPSGADVERLREILKGHNPSASRAEWLKVLQGLHHETQGSAEGLALADEWSSQGENYVGTEDVEGRWSSFRLNHSNPITLASLRVPYVATAEDFEDLNVIEPPVGTAVVDAGSLDVERHKNGAILAHTRNLTTVLRCREALGLRLRFDRFRDEAMLASLDTPDWRPVKDDTITWLIEKFERARFKPIGRDTMRHALNLVASEDPFDSAIEWLDGLTWDGVARIERFLPDYFAAEDSAYSRAVSLYLWTALAGRVLEPGCKADMAPIFVGDQGRGKTRAVESIPPSPDHYVEIDLAQIGETDISRRMRGRLVGEIGELRGLGTKDLESVKTFMSRREEDFIEKFKVYATKFPRRLVFIGTTNQNEFLADETGNRRWLPVTVGKVDVERIRADRLQLWAEGAVRFRAAGIAWQDAERLAPAVHEAHKVTDSWEQTIAAWLDGTDELAGEEPPRRSQPFTMADVQELGLRLSPAQRNPTTDKRVGKILRAMGFVPRVRREGVKTYREWVAK